MKVIEIKVINEDDTDIYAEKLAEARNDGYIIVDVGKTQNRFGSYFWAVLEKCGRNE